MEKLENYNLENSFEYEVNSIECTEDKMDTTEDKTFVDNVNKKMEETMFIKDNSPKPIRLIIRGKITNA